MIGRFHVVVLSVVVVIGIIPGATSAAGVPPAAPHDIQSDAVSRGIDAPTDQQRLIKSNTQSANRSYPDPENDTLGWEDGYWYNESITVTREDGLNQSELSKVVARSMARVEQIRKLEFTSRPPVELISRETFRNRTSERFTNVSARERLYHNTLAEARFFSNESHNWINTIQMLSSTAVSGYYSPREGRIVIISENTTTPKIDEITLAQELLHALQDQRFNTTSRYLSEFQAGTMTTETHNRYDAVIEGDGNFVDYLYLQRCEADWNCLLPQESSAPPRFSLEATGVLLTQAVPYTDGTAFVQSVYQRGGWDAVNDLYAGKIESTEQIIHPSKFGNDTPSTVTIRDQTVEDWYRLSPPNSGEITGIPGQNASYESFGEGGIAMMFLVSSQQVGTNLVDPRGFITSRNIDTYNYTFQPTAGWDGDRLVVYVRNDSVETNETGYVWKTVWDSDQDATEFAETYIEMLNARGAKQVGKQTYQLEQTASGYDDAFHVIVNATTVTIVNAPTVDDLSKIRQSITIEQSTTTPSATPTTDSQEATTDTKSTTSPPPSETSESLDTQTPTASTPGFTAGLTIIAFVMIALLIQYRR